MSPAECLDAVRDLVAAAEEAGWDGTENQGVLDRGREAYAALRMVMADADEGEAAS